ncbi:DUF6522 family protein [Mangrovicella endophytica]|uniref:DUF6522 family protein n=1 Tax=Mangrovicella endophytica TaxID=2066697 RepID=UPI000C9E65E4|nr:DUF6522 family protein [Mangrovicella endophytica]
MKTITRAPRGFDVDADLLAELFRLSAADIPHLMRQGRITSRLDRGEAADAHTWRLTFFYANTRLTLITDEDGQILRASSVTLRGRTSLPPALH